MSRALVIGAGPAGLMAAEHLAEAGLIVTIADQMPSAGRKFLMAGKSGLNLAKDESVDAVISTIGQPALADCLRAFGPDAVQDWAKGLRQEVFTGTSGRIFPKAMKASPLLRAWMGRLGELGVTLQTRWRWSGWEKGAAQFETPEGPQTFEADVVVLACGGASWRRLGSDGAWSEHVDGVEPFAPANVGVSVPWSDHMVQHYGQPLKSIALKAQGPVSRGEVTISARGLEGGGIYSLSPALRSGASLTIDLTPDVTEAALAERWSQKSNKKSAAHFLKSTLRLAPAKVALIFEAAASGRPTTSAGWAKLIKGVPIPHTGLRPIDEAISVAGGLSFDGLDPGFMLKDRAGVFAAGEMLDWEAPTGGYLINACLATGRWAGLHAAAWVENSQVTA